MDKSLLLLPLDIDIETKPVLKKLANAHRALAELKGVILIICTQKASFLCMSSWLCTIFWIICADRYVVTLPQLVDEVAVLSARVEAHLQRMGASYE